MSIDAQIKNLLDSVPYLGNDGKTRLERAIEIAAVAHRGKRRLEDAEYLTHPIAVAQLLSSWQAPLSVLIAGILHDVGKPKYSSIDLDSTKTEFDFPTVALLSEVHRIDSEPERAENDVERRKMWANALMRRSPEALVVKIADRLHNALSIDFLPDDRKNNFASNCINIFSAIAYRLGMADVMRQLQDRAFRAIDPTAYQRADEIYQAAHSWEQVTEVVQNLQHRLSVSQLDGEVVPYFTHRYSIHKRETENRGQQLLPADVVSIRIVTDDCYSALRVVHETYRPLHEVRDYVAVPKANGYRALHTRLLKQDWGTFQITIQSQAMSLVNELGIVARWKGVSEDLVPKIEPLTAAADGSILVFTPAGQPVSLPRDATVIDFAYSIHQRIGDRARYAWIDGQTAPLDSVLTEGNVVEIVKGDGIAGPDERWLSFVKTDLARNYIRHWTSKKTKARFVLKAHDRLGLMAEVTEAVSSRGFNVKSMRAVSEDNNAAEIQFVLEGVDKSEIETLETELRRIPNIILVTSQNPEVATLGGVLPRMQPSARDNPFSTQRPATQTFKGREEETDHIFKRFSGVEKRNTLLIWGQKRIGKTSLLRRVEHYAKSVSPNILPIYVDLQSLGGQPLQLLPYEIVQKAASALNNPYINAPKPGRFKASPLELFTSFFSNLEMHAPDQQILVILDEFQGIVRLKEDMFSRDELFPVFRNLIQHTRQVSFIFCGGGTLNTLMQQSGFTGLLSAVDRIQVQELRRSDAKSLIVDTVEEMELSEETIEYLLDITNCHPNYIQLLCQHLYDNYLVPSPERLELATLLSVIEGQLTLQSSLASSLPHFWEMALGNVPMSRMAKMIVSALAECEMEMPNVRFPDLAQKTSGYLLDGELVNVLKELVEYGTVVQSEDVYRLRIPLFAEWLRAVFPFATYKDAFLQPVRDKNDHEPIH